MNYIIVAYWLFESDIVITDIGKLQQIYYWLFENYSSWLCDLDNYYNDNKKRKYSNCDNMVLDDVKNLL